MISESIDNTDVAEIMINSQRIGKQKFGVTLNGTQLFVNNSTFACSLVRKEYEQGKQN